MKSLTCACVNPVFHYNLDVGLLRINDSADFLEIDSLDNLNILKTYINGHIVAQQGVTAIPHIKSVSVNNFSAQRKKASDFSVAPEEGKIQVIEAVDGQLVTRQIQAVPLIKQGNVVSDTERDILKLTVVNRYKNEKPATGFIKNIGLKRGAIASSIAHDSHNIIAVGTSDDEICEAVNMVIQHTGGITVVYGDTGEIMPLPIAGIMSDRDGFHVAQEYVRLDRLAMQLGSPLRAPFMTLSFMALPVIPALKLTDRGLFDVNRSSFINLFQA
jgi:adenine deaminase